MSLDRENVLFHLKCQGVAHFYGEGKEMTIFQIQCCMANVPIVLMD